MHRSWVAVAVLLLLSANARATVVVDLPLEEMARQAPLVVQGFVEARTSSWSDDGERIITRTQIRVTGNLKGASGSYITLRQTGGEVDGLIAHIPGDARLQVGEEVVLFLEPLARHRDEFVLAGMAASKFRIRRDDTGIIAERSFDDLSFAHPDGQGGYRLGAPQGPAVLPLEALVEAVRRGGGAK